MSCEQVKQSLWDYYDDATTPAQRQTVEAHLASCRECRFALDEWIILSQKAFSRRNVKAPPFLWTRVLAAIESQETEHTAWWLQWQWMSRLASVMTLLVSLAAGMVFYQHLQGAPMESLLSGITTPEQAPNPEQVTAWLVETPSIDKLAEASPNDESRTGGASWGAN